MQNLEEKLKKAQPTLSPIARQLLQIDFECYKSNCCHFLKWRGDLKFIELILLDDTISSISKNGFGGYALYLLAMLDYVSKENDIPLYTGYDWLRKQKLPKLLIPVSISLGMDLFGNDKILKKAMNTAIPEFLKYNILEGDIRNVC